VSSLAAVAPPKTPPAFPFSLPSPIFSLMFSHLPLLCLSWLLFEKEEERTVKEKGGRKKRERVKKNNHAVYLKKK